MPPWQIVCICRIIPTKLWWRFTLSQCFYYYYNYYKYFSCYSLNFEEWTALFVPAWHVQTFAWWVCQLLILFDVKCIVHDSWQLRGSGQRRSGFTLQHFVSCMSEGHSDSSKAGQINNLCCCIMCTHRQSTVVTCHVFWPVCPTSRRNPGQDTGCPVS